MFYLPFRTSLTLQGFFSFFTLKKRGNFVYTLIISGLTAAAILARTGHDVTVLEASSEWSGCAGKFQQRHALFPVGATLGMGFERGDFHKRVLRLLGKQVPVHLLDTVMALHFPNSLFLITGTVHSILKLFVPIFHMRPAGSALFTKNYGKQRRPFARS
jgi:NAD(P)-binding Rossmann-like domain